MYRDMTFIDDIIHGYVGAIDLFSIETRIRMKFSI